MALVNFIVTFEKFPCHSSHIIIDISTSSNTSAPHPPFLLVATIVAKTLFAVPVHISSQSPFPSPHGFSGVQ